MLVLWLLVDVTFDCGVWLVGWYVIQTLWIVCMCLLLRYKQNRTDAKGVQMQADLVTWLESVCRPYEK